MSKTYLSPKAIKAFNRIVFKRSKHALSKVEFIDDLNPHVRKIIKYTIGKKQDGNSLWSKEYTAIFYIEHNLGQPAQINISETIFWDPLIEGESYSVREEINEYVITDAAKVKVERKMHVKDRFF